jgi:phosphoribosyl 1,2-cyclic phosphodiesterase
VATPRRGRQAPDFTVRFWGVRGTVPTPGPDTVRYGGNTSCIEVRCGAERLVFDVGTGARLLGKCVEGEGACDAHIFLTHTHLDHVAGFPFFRPAYDAGNRFHLWAGHLRGQGLTLESTLSDLMCKPLFPVPLNLMQAAREFHDFQAGETLQLASGLAIRTAALRHPGGATGYRVDYAGRSFAIVTDTEHVPGSPDGNILGLIEKCDVVVYDATYTDESFERFRGWGHSTWQEGLRLCEAADAGRLVAFHHDPDSDDATLARLDALLAERRSGSCVAAEGLVIEP